MGESKGEVGILGKDCCLTTCEAALLPSVSERRLCFLAAAFKIPKSGKQPKVSFYSLFSKQSPKPNSQLFLYLAGPLSDFNLFGPYPCKNRPPYRAGMEAYTEARTKAGTEADRRPSI